MKNISKLYVAGLLTITMLTLSCSDSFLEKLPASNYTGETYYASDEAVIKATEPLYNRAWFSFNQRAILGIGSYRANDAWNPYASAEFVRFQTTALTAEVLQAWKSLYTVVTMSNSLLHDISENASADVSEEVKNRALGEAYIMRAAAYFYMLRIWGPVILFENNDEVVLQPQRPLNPTSDVFKFIIRDLRKAINLLPATGSNGHPSKYAAEGLLAKVFLARSGWDNGGTRNQSDLTECIRLCEDVIDNGGYELMSDYEDLFKAQHNDNKETLLAMKWAVPEIGGWGETNALLSDLSFSDVCDVNCWGGSLSASVDMIQLFGRDPKEKKRLRATFFYEDAKYDYIKSASGGYTYTKKWFQLKKGVVGSKEDVPGGHLASMQSPLNTYIIRLADVYLTHAEASLGNQATLNSGRGLENFNAIRRRAGVDPKTAITFEDLMDERRLEFCMEYCNWFDFVSWYMWKPTYMLDFLNNKSYRNYEIRENGVEWNTDANGNKTTVRYLIYLFSNEQTGLVDAASGKQMNFWSDGIRDNDRNLIPGIQDTYVFDIKAIGEMIKANGIDPIINPQSLIHVDANEIFIPYPEADVLQNPFLNKEPQPYNFGDDIVE